MILFIITSNALIVPPAYVHSLVIISFRMSSYRIHDKDDENQTIKRIVNGPTSNTRKWRDVLIVLYIELHRNPRAKLSDIRVFYNFSFYLYLFINSFVSSSVSTLYELELSPGLVPSVTRAAQRGPRRIYIYSKSLDVRNAFHKLLILTLLYYR